MYIHIWIKYTQYQWKTHTYIYIYIYIYIYSKVYYQYIYIYIYIVIPSQTASLYHISSVWLDTLDVSSRDRNTLNFTPGQWHNPSSQYVNQRQLQNLAHMYHLSLVYIFTLSAIEELSSLGELCIARGVTINSFTNIHLPSYVYCISHSINTLGKSMYPIILHPAMGK